LHFDREEIVPKLSVVVPTYNRADLIVQTLDAILSQTISAEIIVIDDGSNDNTESAISGYEDRIRYIKIPNSGDLVARNVGLSRSSGELVAFCDSDDIWAPTFLSVMSAQWIATPDLVSCYANFRILRDGRLSNETKFESAPSGFWDGLRLTGPEGGVFDASIVDRTLTFQPFFPSCMMVSREKFLKAGGWDEGVSRIIGCDFATALRMAIRPPLGIVREPLVSIRKHESNISSNTEKMNLGDADILEYVLRTRPELRHLEKEILRSVAERRAAAIDSAFVRRDFAKFNKFYNALPQEFRSSRRRVKRIIAVAGSLLNKRD
jgi:glycosyltransferase involved in cell wall biosynthesis